MLRSTYFPEQNRGHGGAAKNARSGLSRQKM